MCAGQTLPRSIPRHQLRQQHRQGLQMSAVLLDLPRLHLTSASVTRLGVGASSSSVKFYYSTYLKKIPFGYTSCNMGTFSVSFPFFRFLSLNSLCHFHPP